jgi:hypothetical protein
MEWCTASGTETATVLRYSVNANTWAAMAPMPIPVAGSAAALGADGKTYVPGGVSGGVTTSVVQVYDPAANSWVVSMPLPEGLSASGMGADSLGRLIVTGGTDANGNDVSDVWRGQKLNVPDSAPGFVLYHSQSAIYQSPYVSSINVTGNPQPNYLVLSGPTGLQVDTYSGAIAWTPQAGDIGTNLVTIRATNYAGYADWTYAVAVPHPSPAILANVHVVTATEYTVTLGWDPESPVVGPATFSVSIPHPWHSPRGSGGGVNYQLIGSTTSTNITIGNLRAYDAGGNVSGFAPGVYAVNPVPVPPSLRSVRTSAGGFQLTASEGGSVLQTVLIQATTNPADPNSWRQISSLLPTANPFTFNDTNAAQYPMRCYRIVAP